MKIGVSVKGKNQDSLLDERFARCEYFQVYETDTGDIKLLENMAKLEGGGAGIAATMQLMDEKVDVIITGDLGLNALSLMKKEGIKAYMCEELPIGEVIEKYKKGELKEINVLGPSHCGEGNRLGKYSENSSYK